MNPQIKAALALHAFFFERLGLNYAVIGGIALQFWGEPRFTRDIDITVQDRLELAELVRIATEAFGSRVSDPSTFAKDTRMLLLNIGEVNVDVALALRGYQDVLFERIYACEIGPEQRLHICSAEDLIIHKALAGRPQDLSDIEGVVVRQGDRIDARYVRLWLRKFADALDDPEILGRFERAYARR